MRWMKFAMLGLGLALVLPPTSAWTSTGDRASGAGRLRFGGGAFTFAARAGATGANASGEIVLHNPFAEPATQRFRVICLSVSGSTAVLTGEAINQPRDPAAENRLITHATLDVADFGQPGGGIADEVGITFYLDGTFDPEDACLTSNPDQPIVAGNVVVVDS
jgi:hypothetical protein